MTVNVDRLGAIVIRFDELAELLALPQDHDLRAVYVDYEARVIRAEVSGPLMPLAIQRGPLIWVRLDEWRKQVVDANGD
jgi:hypothetical protein